MKALIKVGYACNENCVFCHARERRLAVPPDAAVGARIERAAKLGHTMVVFSGGEPTLRPELLAWAAQARRLGLAVGLVTNGLRLSSVPFVDRLVEQGLAYVHLSLHGPDAAVHDGLVRASAFDNTLAALRNLSGRGLDVTVNCVVVRPNLDRLDDVADLVLSFPDLRLKFSMLEPKGGGASHFDTLGPTVTETGARVAATLRRALGRGAAARRLGHEGVPLCHVPGFEHAVDDLRAHGFLSMCEADEPDFYPVDDGSRVRPARCAPCALRGRCPGLYRAYLERRGDGELRPATGQPISNSFTYVFERVVATGVPDDRCPLREDGVLPWDRGRHLFVRNGGRVGRFRTLTRDFADEDVLHVKHGTGQLYMDVSSKPAPDDFARDLVALRRSAVCAPCPERAACTGLFEPLFEDVFGRDDAGVRALVAALEGDVLDVGCGHGPYADVLAALAAAGRIRYTGLDPHGPSLARLRARFPGARLEQAGVDALAHAPPERFDHVLVLRSWNHLPEPQAAMRALARQLRPGGRLLVVDNTAFGLARTRPAAQRAESSDSAFEHHRNDTAAPVEELALQAGLRTLERRDTGPATSNQWLLLLQRDAG